MGAGAPFSAPWEKRSVGGGNCAWKKGCSGAEGLGLGARGLGGWGLGARGLGAGGLGGWGLVCGADRL